MIHDDQAGRKAIFMGRLAIGTISISALTIFNTLFPLVAGMFFVVWGVLMGRRRDNRLSSRQSMYWQQLLEVWHISVEEDNLTQVLKDVRDGWWTIYGATLIGVGASMVLVGVVNACILLVTTGAVIGSGAVGGEPSAEVILFAGWIGYGFGYIFGLKRLRSRFKRRVLYSDLRQRRSSDYRSLMIHAIPLGFAVYNVALIVIGLPYLGPNVRLLLFDGSAMWLPRWVMGIAPLVMVLTVVVMEGQIRYIVTFPRLLVTSDLVTAQRLDDMLRSITIGGLLIYEFLTVGGLTFVEARFFNFVVQPPAYVYICMLVATLSALFMMTCAGMIGLFQGRLGGRVAGWPWEARAGVANE